MSARDWNIYDQNANPILSYTSFLGVEVQDQGSVVDAPIEEGSFASYNKVQTPFGLRVTVGKDGTRDELEAFLDSLSELKDTATLILVATPGRLYGPATLESLNYRRTVEAGAYALYVELTIVEIREVKTFVTSTVISGPRNPTSAGNTNTGKTQPEQPAKRRSVLDKILPPK